MGNLLIWISATCTGCNSVYTCNKVVECCNEDFPCKLGEGNCDSDADCVGNLICGYNNCGPEFSWSTVEYWSPGTNCCEGE